MATKAQIKANRENAKKSTGPRTEEGKARVSLNALKHGLLARDAVLPEEDPAEFDRQLRDLEHDLRPENSLEFELVRQIADAQWRMRRLVRIETAFLSAALDEKRRHEERSNPENIRSGREGETQLLGASLLNRTQALLHLARYDAHLSRRYYRAIAELGRLRKLERAAEQYRENQTTKQSQYPEPYEESARYEPPSGPQGWTPTGGDGRHSRPPPEPPILPRPPAPTPPIVDDPQRTADKKPNEPNSS